MRQKITSSKVKLGGGTLFTPSMVRMWIINSQALIWGQDRSSASGCSRGGYPNIPRISNVSVCVHKSSTGAARRTRRVVGETTGARRAAGGGRGTDRTSDMFDFVSASDTVKKQNRRGAARFKAII